MAKNTKALDRRVPVSNVGSPLEDFMAYAGELINTYHTGGDFLVYWNADYDALSESDQQFLENVRTQAKIVESINLVRSQGIYTETEINNFLKAAKEGKVYNLDINNPNRNMAIPADEESVMEEQENMERYLKEQEALRDQQEAAYSSEVDPPAPEKAESPQQVAAQEETQPTSTTQATSATQVKGTTQGSRVTKMKRPQPGAGFVPSVVATVPQEEEFAEGSENQIAEESDIPGNFGDAVDYPDGSGIWNPDGSLKTAPESQTATRESGGEQNNTQGTTEEKAGSGDDFQETIDALGPDPNKPPEAAKEESNNSAQDLEQEEEEEETINQNGPSFNPNNLVNKSGDLDLVLYAQAMAWVESKGNRFAVSPGNAKGLYQFISMTWNGMAVRSGNWDPATKKATGKYALPKDQKKPEDMTKAEQEELARNPPAPDPRFDVDTSTEALISLATGHIKVMEKRKIPITYGHLYMYHCAEALAQHEIPKALDPTTANIRWDQDTSLTAKRKQQTETQAYWNAHYYYNNVSYIKSEKQIREEVVQENIDSGAGGRLRDPFNKKIENEETRKRFNSPENLKKENPKTWLEIYNKKIAVMNAGVKAVLGRNVKKEYQHTVYVEIPKAMNARGFYKLNHGEPVDPALDADLAPGAIGRSDGSGSSGSGDVGSEGSSSSSGNEWWRSGQEISEGERNELKAEQQRSIEDTIIKAIMKLPVKVTDEEANAFKKYQLQVQALYDQGWKLYEEDLTTFNLFYKEHSLSIICDDSNSFPLRGDSSPIICDFISGTSFNLFKKLPIQGIILPTAQYLGKQDDTFLVSLRCNGLNAVKQIEVMRDTLKKQAILYKYIPSSFSLKVENNFINAFGNLYFVINGMENSTQPETPGSYAVEMRLTANDIVTKDTLINRESTVSTAEIKETFLKELLTNTKGLIEPPSPAEAYPESTPDACAPNGSAPTEPTTTPVDPPTQSMMEEITEKRIYLRLREAFWNKNYDNLIEHNSDETESWMSPESKMFLDELCAVINLCKLLIIPTGYHYAHRDYKLKYPLHKKLIKIFYDANPAILTSSLPLNQPLYFLKRYKGEVNYKNQPNDTKYVDYYNKAEEALENIAPVLWDYVLEYEHIEYDISDSILRATAFTSIDAEQYLPYARAREAWAKEGGKSFTPFFPYLATHRAVNVMSNNTIYCYLNDLALKDSPILKSFGGRVDSKGIHQPSKHFFQSHYFTRDRQGSPQIADWWLTVNSPDKMSILGEQEMTVISSVPPGGSADQMTRKSTLWYLWPYKSRIESSTYYTVNAWRGVSSGPANQGGGIVREPQAIELGKQIRLDHPNTDFKKPYYNITWRSVIDLIDESLMEYIWNYLIIPYINNALNYENIYLLATETNSFPKTLELISRQIQTKIQPTYSDLMLPKHPYWNEKDANALRGTAFTEPDFYLFNVSTESDFERNSERVEYVSSDNALKGDQELALSPEAAYNLSIEAEVETRMAEVEGLQQLDYDLNVKNKVIGKGNSASYGKKIPKASRFEYYRAAVAPKTIIPTQNVQGTAAQDSVIIKPQSDRVEWSEVALMFGENLDLVGSLSANVGSDQKLLNNRLINYAWQDYDAISAEDRIRDLRNSYFAPLIEVPVQPGTVAGKNPNPKTDPIADSPGNKGLPFPEFDWSEQRVLVIGSSSAMGIGDRLGKNLGYENKTAAAYLNIGVGGTAVRHWATNRHVWPKKWHYVDKKDANGNPILHTEGKKKGKPVREKIIDETVIPIDALEKALSEFKPTVIHIILGANDDAEKHPPNKADVASILHIKNRLKDYITTWWVGPGSTKFPANPKFRQTIKENWGPYYYDWTTVDPTFPIQYLTGDKVHLTPEGSTKWAEVFKQVTQDGIFKEGVPADQCTPPPPPAPGSVPSPAGTTDGLPAPNQGDPAKTRMVSKFFQFWEEEEEGSGDTSPYMNFSNTRYPTYVKLKDAIKSVNRRKMAGRRAYPVCKVYFIEEDNIYNRDTFELDEIYSYSEVESLEISDSRKRPASVAKITFLDPHGILSGYNQWAAAASPRFLQEKQNLRNGSENELSTESSLKGVRGSRYEQSDISFALKAGLKIKICLGFSNDANKLEEVFLGEITDVNLDGSGDRIEVVALSYGAELAAVTKGVIENDSEKEYNDTFDLLAHLMFEPEVIHFGKKKFSEITMFGEDQSLKTNQIQYKETFARGGSMNLKRGGGLVNTFLAGWEEAREGVTEIDLIDSTWDLWNRKIKEADKELGMEPFAGPQDDNIFAPNFLPSQGSYAYDWFARWQKKVSGDYDLRVIDRTSKVANPGISGPSTTIAGILGGVASLGTMVGVALVAIISFAAGAYVTAAGILLLGAVVAVGIGILAAACVNFVIDLSVAGFDYITNNKKVAQRENLIDKDGNKTETADDVADSALLIHTYSPDELKYNIFHSTIWDIFQEMTLRHPGYVAHPRIYEKSNRMTMFFGLPDQNMWCTAGNPQDTIKANAIFKAMARDAEAYYRKEYNAGELIYNGWGAGDGKSDGAPNDIQSFRASRTTGGGSENVFQDNNSGKLTVRADLLNTFLRYVRKRYKPFRKWHNVNSYTDIISNDIEASSQGWFTVVNIQYQYTRWWGADSAAEDAVQKYEDRARALKIDDAANFAEWDENRAVKQKANLDLAPNHERTTTFQFLNAKSKGMAKTYGRAKLAHEAKEMYKGSLTIMGSPHIRPYDVVMVNDTYNNMYGPIEVEEIHHIFSPETGYISVIYPDTFIINEDVTPYLLWNGLSADVYNRTEFYMETSMAAYPSWGDLQNISSKGRAYFAQLRDVILEYRRSAQKQSIEVDEVQGLFDTFSWGVGAGTAVGSAMLGYTTASLYAAGVGLATGGLLLVGAAALGVAALLYASYKLNDIILNYVSESRSYMIVPLMREGIPMVSGINITSSSGMYKTPLQYMRQYWMDGGQGRALEQTDTLMKYSYMYQRRGGDLNNWLARAQVGWDKFTLDWSSAFHDAPEMLVQPALFGINKK